MQNSTGSHVGSLSEGLPPYIYDPPIEAVVFGWGVNEDGQLGLDTEGNVVAPKVVEALLGTRFCGRLANRSPLVAGSRNTLAIDADGQVLTWGWNARGTLGHGHRGNERKPRRVAGLQGRDVQQVAIGGWHCLAVDSTSQAYAWGGNEYGQCGVEAPEGQRDVVHPTRCLLGTRVRQVAAGGMHSLALTETGEIWQWGEPWGDFSMAIDRRPRRIDATGDFVDISCGAFHSLALNASGQCFTWGINDFGQLGNGTTSYATAPEQVDLGGVFVADVAAGGWHSMAISAEGEVFVWGRGEYGRLGLGDRAGTSRLRPQKVKALEGHRVVEGSCGGTHTMVVTAEGRCFIWGRGSFGRLGTGGERDCPSPVEVKLPGGPERWRIITAAAGGRHSLVLALPDNGSLEARQAEWEARKPLYSPSPPRSALESVGLERELERSWAAEADDEAEDGGSPDGASMDGGASAEQQLELKSSEEEGALALDDESTPAAHRVSFVAAAALPGLEEDEAANHLPANVEGIAGALRATSLGLRDDEPVDRA